MKHCVALSRAALLLFLTNGAGASAQQTLGVSAELRVGSLAMASKDGSAGAESLTSAPTTPTPTTPMPTPPIPTTQAPTPPTTVTPTPTPTPTSSGNDNKDITRPSDPPHSAPPSPPTTTTPPPTPPSPTSDDKDTSPGNGLGDDPTTAPPRTTNPPGPIDPGSPQPPDSPSPPVVQPGEVVPPRSPSDGSSSAAATPAPVGSPTSVPYMPDPLSPSPPTSVVDTPEQAPFTSEIRESRTPSTTSSGTTATSPSTSSSSSSSSLAGVGATPTPKTKEYTVGTTGTTTNPPQIKQYRRGDSVILVKKQLSDGTIVDVEVVVSGSNAPALLVRDITTKSSVARGAAKAHSTSWLAVTVSALAALTLLLVMLTHFVAVEPSFTASLPLWMRPNQWELLVFITYIQAMASTAHYAITAVPVSLWGFLDAFSWTVFIPNHHSDSAISVKTDSPSRRLSEVVVLDGLVAFADRIGIDETSLLQTSVTGMVVIYIVILLVALAIMLLVKSRRDKAECAKTSNDPFGLGVLPRTLAINDTVQPVRVIACPPVLLMCGVVVVVGVFALYPVTLLATFEIASQIRAQLVSAKSLVIAGLVVLIVPVLLLVRSISVLMAVESEADFTSDQKYRAIWGVLSSRDCIRYDSRVVFAGTWLAMQFASAVVVGAVLSATWQLVLLLAIDVVFLAMFLLNRPFTDENQVATVATLAVAVLKALNISLAFASSSGTSTPSSSRHQGAATAFVAINSLVVVGWCGRQLLTALQAVKLYWTIHSPRKNTVESSVGASNNHAPSLPPSQLSQSPWGAQYESTLYVALASTQEGHRGTAVL